MAFFLERSFRQKGDCITPAELWREFQGLLGVTTEVSGVHGQDLNVDEDFTLEITVTNRSEGREPMVVFRDINLAVIGTRYAKLKDAIGPANGVIGLHIADTLYPGHSITRQVEMTAQENIGGFADIFFKEQVASVTASAGVDLDRYFQVSTRVAAFEEIVPT